MRFSTQSPYSSIRRTPRFLAKVFLCTYSRDPPTSKELRNRLEMILQWYRGMIVGETGRLAYLYDPESDTAKMDASPIRDIASIWDMEILSDFLSETGICSPYVFRA